MNGKKAKQLRRLAKQNNTEQDDLISVNHSVARLGWVRLYRGLKKWRKTRMGNISKGRN
jgi:hypothetical protein